MGVYTRRDSPTLWMSMQLNGQRVRMNTMVEDRQLAEELFSAWKTELARTRFAAEIDDRDFAQVAIAADEVAEVGEWSHRQLRRYLDYGFAALKRRDHGRKYRSKANK